MFLLITKKLFIFFSPNTGNPYTCDILLDMHFVFLVSKKYLLPTTGADFFFFPLHHPFLQLILMEVGMRSAAEHRKELKLESGNSVSGWIQILFFFFFKHPVRRSKLAYHT